MKKCDLQINAFASCAKEEGVFVIFRCREFRKFGVRITTKNTMFSILKESNLLDRYGMKTIRRTSGERMHGRLQLRRKIWNIQERTFGRLVIGSRKWAKKIIRLKPVFSGVESAKWFKFFFSKKIVSLRRNIIKHVCILYVSYWLQDTILLYSLRHKIPRHKVSMIAFMLLPCHLQRQIDID